MASGRGQAVLDAAHAAVQTDRHERHLGDHDEDPSC
jgi:hypothetical protein